MDKDNRLINSFSKYKNRDSRIELLRILAIIMIISCHFATHGGFSFASGTITIPRLWWNILELGGGFGVDIFIMITGYFLISNTDLAIKKEKILLLWIQIVTYSILLFIISSLLGYNEFSIIGGIKSLFPVSFSTWWFASTYFVFYLLHPYVNIILNSFDKMAYKRFIALLIVMWSVIPMLTIKDFQANALSEFLLLYSIGGYIRKFSLFDSFSSKKWFALWFAFTFITFLTSLILLFIGRRFDIADTHSTYFYGRTNLLTIGRAICFFMFFLKLKMKNNYIVNMLSSEMFGVYLLHDNYLMRTVLWKDIFHNSSYQSSIGIIPYSIIVTLIVFLDALLWIF